VTKHRFTVGLVAALAAVSVIAGAFAAPAGAARQSEPGRPTIAGIVASSGSGFDTTGSDFDVLLAAVSAADLVETLDTAGLDVTVWAPKDRAFVRTAQDLGFTGANTDEAGAWAFLVDALTDIGGGDPIPTLTTILEYHVTPGTRLAGEVLATAGFPTLAGIDIRHSRGSIILRDKDPDFRNPRLLGPLNVRASNGVVHVINRVLLPVNL
jgi:serralysin